MTPETLSAYLFGKGLDPDAVQDVLVAYLTWTGAPIRHPKAWAWRYVCYRTLDAYRKHSMQGHRVALSADLVSTLPSPLLRAEQRQQIERFHALMCQETAPRQRHWTLFNTRV